jgi:pyroglutamyl-peptidase
MSAPEVLITGFGPFPGVAWNPSAWLVQTLARTHARPLTGAVLPVSWQTAWAALEPLLDAARPRQVILFGVSREARGFCLEQRAYNARSDHADAEGATPENQRLLDSPAENLDATLPITSIASTIAAAGIPVELSEDPGRYLCNALLFHSLHWAQHKPTRVGFVHLPHVTETGPLTPAQALTGARLIVETAIRAESAVPATA